MTHPLTPREKVARIVDPLVFELVSALENAEGEPEILRRDATAMRDRRLSEVFGKADAILTALASGSGEHAGLAKLAEAATPGPWSAADWDDDFGENRFTVQATEPEELSAGQLSIWPGGICCLRVAETIDGERPAEDAAFIAAANPATVLALLAEIAALRAERDKEANDAQLIASSCDKLRVHHRDEIMDALRRATEAERKLAEAETHIARLADDLEVELSDRFGDAKDHYPTIRRQWERDMDPVFSARTFISKEAERG